MADRPTRRHLARIEQVIATFVRHGLNLPEQARLWPWRRRLAWLRRRRAIVPWPIAVRDALIELGPAFIKAGQVLSVRSDLIPEALAEALRTLQDAVPPAPAAAIVACLEHELGAPLDRIFRRFDHVPIAAASIAQVHEAELLDGRRVAVKVKRPGIDAIVMQDMEVVGWLADRLERFAPWSRKYQPAAAARQLRRYTLRELDLRIEANVTRRLAEAFAEWPDVLIPAVYDSRAGLIIEQFVESFPADDVTAMAAFGLDRAQVVKSAVDAVLAQIYEFGLFHGDPHPGNMRVTPDGRVVFLDFGIFGELSDTLRRHLAMTMIFLARDEIDWATTALLRIATPTAGADPAGFRRAVVELYQEWRGASMQEYGFARLVSEQVALGARHGLRFPTDAILFTKAMLTLEGVALGVDPSLDLTRVGGPYLEALARRMFSWHQLMTQASWALPLWIDWLGELPVQQLTRLQAPDDLVDDRALTRHTGDASGRTIYAGMLVLAGAWMLAAGVPPIHDGLSATGALTFLVGVLLGARAWPR